MARSFLFLLPLAAFSYVAAACGCTHLLLQPGVNVSCNAYYRVKDNDTCSGIVTQYKNFTLGDFLSWNLAVGKECKSLLLGYDVCVGVQGFVPSAQGNTLGFLPNTWTNCTKYTTVEQGSSCSAVVNSTAGLTLDNFYKWNPSINSGCTNLLAGYSACIAGPSGSQKSKRSVPLLSY